MGHVTLFTGHRVDAKHRKTPRFPAHLASAAKAAISQHLRPGLAVSSAANGGDILFLEACRAQGIAAHIVLPFTVEAFIQSSVVSDAAGHWQQRFQTLWAETPAERRHILTANPTQNPYAACNHKILDLASRIATARTLVALWDGKAGDGAGGTASFVDMARMSGCAVEIIDPRELGR